MGKGKKDANNNNDTKSSQNNTTTESSSSQQPQQPKKSKWRKLFERFSMKKKASSPQSEVATAFESNDQQQEPSENTTTGPGCVGKRRNKKKKSNEDTDGGKSRRTKSELNVTGKSSKKKKPKTKRSRKPEPSPAEVEVEPALDKTVFEDAPKTEEQPTQDVTMVDASAKSTKGKAAKNDMDGSAKTAKRKTKEENLDGSAKTAKKLSKEDLDGSGKRRKLNKSTDDPLSVSQSFKRGLRNFRDNRAKNFRSVKTFISRKYQERAMKKVIAQVEARQQKRSGFSELEQSSNGNGKLHQGDDVFPQRRPHNKAKTPNLVKETTPPTKPPTREPTPTAKSTEGFVFIETNNNNAGDLFLPNGRPFWHQNSKGKPGEADDDEELTDDELPMNAEVILDVHRGKIALADMPTDPVVLEPYGALALLEGHDNAFFTRDLIFSNTVRSMINLNDDLTDPDHVPKRPPTDRRCRFVLPDIIHRYSRHHPDEFKRETFTPKHTERT